MRRGNFFKFFRTRFGKPVYEVRKSEKLTFEESIWLKKIKLNFSKNELALKEVIFFSI